MSDWRRTTLGEVCRLKAGNAFPQSEQGRASGYAPFIKVSDLGLAGNSSSITEANNWVSEGQVTRLRLKLFPEGTSVFAKIGEGMRSERIRQLTVPTAIDNNLMAAVPKTGTDAGFLHYLLHTVRLASHAVGSALPYLRQSTLTDLPVTIPAHTEQQAIAAVLGVLDDKIAANIALATTARQTAHTEFLVRVRGISPRERRFADVAEISGGGTPSTKNPAYWNGEIPWATPTDITALAGPYIESTSRTLTEAGLSACSSKLFAPGAILMTSRATIGAMAIAQVPTAVNQGFIVVEPEHEELRWWLFHEMQDRTDEFRSWANGATFLELSRGSFKNLGVRLPEPAALRSFSELASSLHDVARASLGENRTLAATRDALLPRLMSGKLRVSDAESRASAAGA